MTLSPTQQITASLMAALGFTGDDLLLNRVGQLSAAQAERVRGRLRAGTQAGWRIMAFVLVVFMIGAVLIIVTTDLLDTLRENPVILVVLGGTLLVWGVMVVFALLRSRRTASQTTWPVYSVTGKVKVNQTNAMPLSMASAAVEVGGEGVASGTLQIGGVYLALYGHEVHAFRDGMMLTVYYVGSKRGGVPVSAEAVQVMTGR